ncbi:hypothetical protein BP6252_14164 [Coleophoma cylindrospora]|uniref:PNPLA domain-containing protein n=1 Tax=Coleophoma cylindrospora TaxID=1849047 RepID=A0A3D8Q3X5_9HELO|nr:hypothetical protein BP6252_14164 [Coleophoma cylindrospora]
MPTSSRPECLRVLCLDGGGIKGYTSLLILGRILRTMKAEGQLAEIPKPCQVFDLIVGTSTGGIIAVMLGRLHMTIDECIAQYEQVGGHVFGKKPYGGKVGKALKGLTNSAFYDIKILQDEVKKVLDSKGIAHDEEFRESSVPTCKVALCVTRSEITKPDVLRNYESLHPSAENYDCKIWEAASATAAAPMYFKGVQFNQKGEKWCDGGLRRNNPINEALAELSRERDWKYKKVGCVLSLGTGVAKSLSVSSNLAGILKGAVAIMTDSDDIARVFASSELGIELFRTNRYFRFSVPQGMQDLQLDEWKETERMRALTTDYLAHAANGDLLERCAKSLLDPDVNLQIEIQPKHSLMPHHPCNHFMERRIYAETLQQFFRSKTQLSQTFVLWGMGGIGKTQIALKFAQSMRHRLSVLWVRADQFTNFAADYFQILKEIDPDSAGKYQNADLDEMLQQTRRKLESTPDEWLLILDNADDLDAFLGRSTSRDSNLDFSISTYLPRHGRLLITTRDRRFQGTVAAAADGMLVGPMSEDEAVDLLLQSIPQYLIRNQQGSIAEAQQLVEELDYLPLAIAQAAANILEQQLTLAEYVSFYQDKKQRMGLMQTPAHDFQTTDPRNASQSVNVTWQISFDILKEHHPLSAKLLIYIGCFHWRNIPRAPLKGLPEFRDLTEASFIQLTKKPLSLSLMDEEEAHPGFVEYMVHPLIHERILSQITTAKLLDYLAPLVDLFSTLFPFGEQKGDSTWPLAVYLIPHAVQIMELCDEHGFRSKSFSILVLRMSRFFGNLNRFSVAVDMAEKAMALGVEAYDSSPDIMVVFWTNVCAQYSNASRYKDAEQQAREALEWLDSESVQTQLDPQTAMSYRLRFQVQLEGSLTYNDDRGSHREREKLIREGLATGLIDEWSHEGLVTRHNLAHALLRQEKIEEAKDLNNTLLAFAEVEVQKNPDLRRDYLIMLNLRSRILRRTPKESQISSTGILGPSHAHGAFWNNNEDVISIHERVFKESVEQLGFEDIDTWKAINNLVYCLSMTFRRPAEGRILMQVLPAGIEARVRAEGKFTTTIQSTTDAAENYLDLLEDTQGRDSKAATEFRLLLHSWNASTGLSKISESKRNHNSFNNVGVNHQVRGRFEQAEKCHLASIECFPKQSDEVPALYRYNLMLAIARQGRVDEALVLREGHRAEILVQEQIFGALEHRLAEDARIRDLYEHALVLADSGKLEKEGEWWLANEIELRRAEYRYGLIDILPQPEKPPGMKESLTNTLKRMRLGQIK